MSLAAGPQCLFTLASGRSGTSYLADFFRSHVPACYSTHEPYLTPGNPALFGPAIAWNSEGNDARLLPLLERKCRFIRQRRQACYFEGSHAFLKSFNRHAPALLHNPGFVHLLRNPQQVAKSELLREQVIRRFHVPLVDYRRDNGSSCFRWSLTGDEPVFRQFAQSHAAYPLSRFGFYVLQWFEIEYRAMQLLQHHDWSRRVFTLDVATQLHDEHSLAAMLDFFALPQPRRFNLDLHRNKTWFAGPSTLTLAEQDEYRFILQNLPEAYRDLVQQAPYASMSFAAQLQQA